MATKTAAQGAANADAEQAAAAKEPERVSPVELAELAAAQEAMARVNAMLAQVQEALVKAVGVHEYLSVRLRERHVLGKDDAVLPDGVIRRGAAREG